MQYYDSPDVKRAKSRIPYISISGVIFLVILFVVLWKPLKSTSLHYVPLTDKAEANNDSSLTADMGTAAIELVKETPPIVQEQSVDEPTPEDDIVQDEIDKAINENSAPTVHIVGKGDTLSGILSQNGVNRADIYQFTNRYKQLANLRIGQKISWQVDENQNLKTFIWYVNAKDTRVYEKQNGQFVEQVEQREGKWKKRLVRGTISGSFIADAKHQGLTSAEIAKITKALQWKLDFRRLQKGDQFAVLISREMFGDRFDGTSQVLAVRVRNGNRDYYAIQADDGQYYDVDGRGLSRSFLRYPLQKTARVSSGFSPRRLNPVTKRYTAHNGVDFAVSRGTPVLATGDGEVVVAKYSGSAGNFIALRHGHQFMTRYMHLDRILVKAGQKVYKGQKIGLSGNTGRSTGPHLHYELWRDSKAVNPLTTALPQSGGLTGKSKAAYLEVVKKIKPRLQFADEKAVQTASKASAKS